MLFDGTESRGKEIFPWWQHLAYVCRVILSCEKYFAPHVGQTWSIKATSSCCLCSSMISWRASTRLFCSRRRFSSLIRRPTCLLRPFACRGMAWSEWRLKKIWARAGEWSKHWKRCFLVPGSMKINVLYGTISHTDYIDGEVSCIEFLGNERFCSNG